MARPPKRKEKTRKQKKIYSVFYEGKTECEYMQRLCKRYELRKYAQINEEAELQHSEQKAALKKRIKKGGVDEGWLVFDRDRGSVPEDKLKEIIQWVRKTTNAYLALSNPRFEYWLLLHFHKGNKIDERNLNKELQKYLKNYNKTLGNEGDIKKLLDHLDDAIANASARVKDDAAKKPAFPPNKPFTTFHLLVKSLLKTLPPQ